VHWWLIVERLVGRQSIELSHTDCQSTEIWFKGTFGSPQFLLLFGVAAECVGTGLLH